ncbi:hypothetical protein V2I52_15130, partial [Brenneria sp. g21c3]|uniref:hypothetical protein n=1 Tax=Brenneria sp. g21c3 TaxID=3093893 RepID=UPI002EBDBA33|nr:hypothetical protein [Brenneria sp. g21c3]
AWRLTKKKTRVWRNCAPCGFPFMSIEKFYGAYYAENTIRQASGFDGEIFKISFKIKLLYR